MTATSLQDGGDTTKLWLIYANRRECDILLRKELDAWAEAHPDRFKVFYCLSDPPVGWAGGCGRISEEMVKQHMPPPGEDSYIGLCGPQGFVHNHVSRAWCLLALGVPSCGLHRRPKP